jgi:hypothetical protein
MRDLRATTRKMGTVVAEVTCRYRSSIRGMGGAMTAVTLFLEGSVLRPLLLLSLVFRGRIRSAHLRT